MSSSADAQRLEALSKGFRGNYLTHDTITAQLRAWADAFPRLARVKSIGTTLEGREIQLLVIGPDPDRTRPSVWVDGNMHAQEVCGSSVALAIAEDVLRLHLDPNATLHGLPQHVCERLRDVLFYVLPRMCPDGAEAVLTTGRYVRSNPRDRRPESARAKWIARDVDGDGVAMLIRRRDPSGEFVESTEFPGLMLPRRLEDEGPFYKVYPEGIIANFDGSNIPDPDFLSDNDTDLNRNFPWSWMPEPEQVGAGRYATSEPESRALVEFVTEHPEIFAWFNLHTFGGCYIRPLGHAPDKKMDPGDLALFRQIGEWGERFSGYPMVSGFDEFLYEPDRPLHGDLADFAFHQRGAIGFVCELWDLFRQIGMERKKPFVDHYTHISREQMLRLAKWDAEHNASRVIRPWRPFEHPQIGPVEVGGVDARVGMVNPPYEQLGRVCTEQTAFFFRVAALAPHVVIARASVNQIDGAAKRVEVTIENRGYLPTYVLGEAKKLPWNEPLSVSVRVEGCALASESEALREVGHLEGWGRGLYAGDFALYFQRSRGSVSAKTLGWTVRGSGILHVRVGSCRTGYVESRVEV
jgi:hypothetical protein